MLLSWAQGIHIVLSVSVCASVRFSEGRADERRGNSMLMFYCSADIQKKIRVRQEKRSVDKMGRCIEIICTKISFNVVIRMH